MPADSLQTSSAWQHATCCCWLALRLLLLQLMVLLQLLQAAEDFLHPDQAFVLLACADRLQQHQLLLRVLGL
jgi:hypothetical protein